jgi:hypothetical protein
MGMTNRPALLGAPLLLTLAACSGASGGASGTGGACSFTTPVPAAPSTPAAGASVQAQAEAGGLGTLDAIFGGYLRGSTRAYRGSLEAHDNYNSAGSAIEKGPALASLEISGDQAVLTIHSLPQHEYLYFAQSKKKPEITQVGVILGDTSTGGDVGTCKGCVPDLFTSPASISFDNLVASSRQSAINPAGTGETSFTVSTHATASLEVAEPCSLAYSDLIELASLHLTHFAPSGGDMVWQTMGRIFTGQKGLCQTYVPYSLDLFVDPTNLADYGVRNYQPGAPGQECGG